MKLRCFVKTTLYGLFALICFSQCYTILIDYFSYPIVIDMTDVSPSLVSGLPGITICNNNRLSLKRLAKRNQAISAAMEERFPGWNKQPMSYHDRKEFNNFRDEVGRIFEQNSYNPSDEMSRATMDELFIMKPDNNDLIKRFECARTWKDSIECDELTRIESIQDRRCTTLLFKGAMYHDSKTRPYLFSASQNDSINHDSHNHSYFAAKEVIKILVDFEPEDYADLKRQIGSRLIIHGSNTIGSTNNLDFFITRGHRYEFNIYRQDFDLRRDPRVSCVNYIEESIEKFTDNIDMRVPLSGDSCFQNCLVYNMIKYSNCWPPTMPYFLNDTLDPGRTIKQCTWFQGIHQIPLIRTGNTFTNKSTLLPVMDEHLVTKTKMRVYRKMRRFCFSQCAFSCQFTGYPVTVTKASWPTNVQIFFDENGQEQRHLRHCCALIIVKYAHFHYNVHEFKLKYDWTDTLGNIGGLLAVWLGISIVSIYRWTQKLAHLITKRVSSGRVDVGS